MLLFAGEIREGLFHQVEKLLFGEAGRVDAFGLKPLFEVVAGLELGELVEEGFRRGDGVFTDPSINGPLRETKQGSHFGIWDFVVGDLLVDRSFGEIEILG